MHFDFDSVVATVTQKKQKRKKTKSHRSFQPKKVVALHLARKGQNAKMLLKGVK